MVIFYDAWVTSNGYRGRLARRFDLTALHDPFERIAAAGGGSSFGQVEVNPADLMRRADFLNAAEKEILNNITSDPEIKELADRIAGEVARLSAFEETTTVN
jgi:hypothetical protein